MAATPEATLWLVESEEPTRPRTLRPEVPRDLETICLKCLEKEPGRRYADAQELADDLARFRQGQPIRARPAGRVERALKWTRQHPTAAALYAVLVLLTLVGTFAGTVTWLWREARETGQQLQETLVQVEIARDEAEGARRRKEGANQRLAAVSSLRQVDLAYHAWQDNEIIRAQMLLAECPRELRHWEWHYVDRLCHSELRTLPCYDPKEGGVITLSSDGRRLVTASGKMIRVLEADAGAKIAEVPSFHLPDTFAFSPDGQLLVYSRRWDNIYFWDFQKGQRTEPFLSASAGAGVLDLALNGDGNCVATAMSDRTVRLWDRASKKLLHTLTGHTGTVVCLAFSPDGQRLASGSSDKTVRVWDVASGQLLYKLQENRFPFSVEAVTFSPDGKYLAAASHAYLGFWEADKGRAFVPFKDATVQQANRIGSLAFSPDGKYFAAGAADGLLKVWRWDNRGMPQIFKGHTGAVTRLAFSADSRQLRSASKDGTVKVWDPTLQQEQRYNDLEKESGRCLALSPDGKLAACGTRKGNLRVYELATGQEVLVFKGHTNAVNSVAFNPRGNLLASASSDATVRIWNLQERREERTLPGSERAPRLAFSPDGSRLLVGGPEHHLCVWDLATGREVFRCPHDDYHSRVVFSPDGRHLAYSDQRRVRLWNAATGAELPFPQGTGHRAIGLAFSSDGRRLAGAGTTGDVPVLLWDLDTGGEPLVWHGHNPFGRGLLSVAFSPDGRRLVSGADSGVIKMWDVDLGQESLTLSGFGPVWGLAFTPDGHQLVACCGAGLFIWDARPRPE